MTPRHLMASRRKIEAEVKYSRRCGESRDDCVSHLLWIGLYSTIPEWQVDSILAKYYQD